MTPKCVDSIEIKNEAHAEARAERWKPFQAIRKWRFCRNFAAERGQPLLDEAPAMTVPPSASTDADRDPQACLAKRLIASRTVLDQKVFQQRHHKKTQRARHEVLS